MKFYLCYFLILVSFNSNSQSFNNTVDDIVVLKFITKHNFTERIKLFFQLTKKPSENNYLCSNIFIEHWINNDIHSLIGNMELDNTVRLNNDYYDENTMYYLFPDHYNYDTLSSDPLKATYSNTFLEFGYIHEEKVLLKHYFNQNLGNRILFLEYIVKNYTLSAPLLSIIKEDLDSLLKVKTEDFIIDSKWLKQGAFSSEIFNRNILIWKSKLKWK